MIWKAAPGLGKDNAFRMDGKAAIDCLGPDRISPTMFSLGS